MTILLSSLRWIQLLESRFKSVIGKLLMLLHLQTTSTFCVARYKDLFIKDCYSTCLVSHTLIVIHLQIHRDFRKPLIVMAPKNLLRHKKCVSNLSEFDDVKGHPGFDKQGTRFKRLIKDQSGHSDLEEGIRRLVLCSGKVKTVLIFSFFYLCF